MKSNIKVIGITGGIGSGKSWVCKIFASLGYRIYDADSRAKVILLENEKVKIQIIEAFGENAYLPDGTYNKIYMSSQVFSDKSALQKLNQIVHPATRQDFYDWLEQTPSDYPHRYIIKEAAILFESGSYQDADKVITVYAPQTLRMERVKNRDHLSEKEILQRMKNQWFDSKKIHLSDFTIFNDGVHSVIEQVVALHEKWK